MASFTSRYGNPAVDYKGAHMWAYCRHGATVVAVKGRVDARNVDAVTEYASRFIAADTHLVLDLSGVSAFTPRGTGLLDAVEERCSTAGVDWALVPGEAAARRLGLGTETPTLPIISTVAEAERRFDDAILRRRRFLLPLLGRTA